MLRRAGQSTDLGNLSVLSGMDKVIIHSKTKRAPCARLTLNINTEVRNLGCVEPTAIHISGVLSAGVLTRHTHTSKLLTITTKTTGL